jgi:hypothetical protein
MMTHDNDSYMVIIKAGALLERAHSLYHSKSRGETSVTRHHLEYLLADLSSLTKAIQLVEDTQ